MSHLLELLRNAVTIAQTQASGPSRQPPGTRRGSPLMTAVQTIEDQPEVDLRQLAVDLQLLRLGAVIQPGSTPLSDFIGEVPVITPKAITGDHQWRLEEILEHIERSCRGKLPSLLAMFEKIPAEQWAVARTRLQQHVEGPGIATLNPDHPEPFPGHIHPRVTGSDLHNFRRPYITQMSDGSPPPVWDPNTWAKNKLAVLSLGEGHGTLILQALLESGHITGPDDFAEAPFVAIDAGYGVLRGGQFCFDIDYNRLPRVEDSPQHYTIPPRAHWIGALQALYPRHFRYGLFQELDLQTHDGRRQQFDLIHAIEGLGWVLSSDFAAQGFDSVRHTLNRTLDHLKPNGTLLISGWGRPQTGRYIETALADQLEVYIKRQVEVGLLRAYNTNFKTADHGCLLLVKAAA